MLSPSACGVDQLTCRSHMLTSTGGGDIRASRERLEKYNDQVDCGIGSTCLVKSTGKYFGIERLVAVGGMDPSGKTVGISFPFGRVAAAFAIRLISGGHEHDKLDPMTAFILRRIKSPGWSFPSTTIELGILTSSNWHPLTTSPRHDTKHRVPISASPRLGCFASLSPDRDGCPFSRAGARALQRGTVFHSR